MLGPLVRLDYLVSLVFKELRDHRDQLVSRVLMVLMDSLGPREKEAQLDRMAVKETLAQLARQGSGEHRVALEAVVPRVYRVLRVPPAIGVCPVLME